MIDVRASHWLFVMFCETFVRKPATNNAPPIVASFAHVKVPVKDGLARGALKTNCASTYDVLDLNANCVSTYDLSDFNNSAAPLVVSSVLTTQHRLSS